MVLLTHRKIVRSTDEYARHNLQFESNPQAKRGPSPMRKGKSNMHMRYNHEHNLHYLMNCMPMTKDVSLHKTHSMQSTFRRVNHCCYVKKDRVEKPKTLIYRRHNIMMPYFRGGVGGGGGSDDGLRRYELLNNKECTYRDRAHRHILHLAGSVGVTISKRSPSERNNLCSKWFPQNSSPECLGTEVTELSAQSCAIRIRNDLVDSKPSLTRRRSILKDIAFYLSEERSWPGAEQDLSELGPAPADMLPEVSAEDINKDILEIDRFLLDGTMFHDSALKCENFQDLRLWCSASPSEDTIATDFLKTTAEDTDNQTTSPTLYPSRVWNGRENEVDSPLGQGSFFTTTPHEVLSPASDIFTSRTDQMFSYRSHDNSLDKEVNLEAEIFDITNIPVILGHDEQGTSMSDVACAQWTDMSKSHTQYHNTTVMNLNEEESSMDVITWPQNVTDYREPIDSFTPINGNETVISEYVINEVDNKIKIDSDILLPYNSNYMYKNVESHPLRLNIRKPATTLAEGILGLEPVIGTPDILNCVEQLEAEKFGLLDLYLHKSTEIEDTHPCTEEYTPCTKEEDTEDKNILEEPLPEVPKIEPLDSDEDRYHHTPAVKRRRRDSEDSDETYTPYVDRTPIKKQKKRKAILILPLEEPKKVRRGRPPKRRESLASTCTTDDNQSSISIEEFKYRELRDKNNEASKRSRMNRKQKEQEMEQLGVQLEERNKKLRVKAEILEELTKKLKDALLTGMLGR